MPLFIIIVVLIIIANANKKSSKKKQKNKKGNSNKQERFIDGKNEIPNYVLLDTETTGLDARSEKILELSMIRVRNHEIVAKYSQMFNPNKPIPIEASRINGITDKMVSDKPLIQDCAEDIKAFIGNDIVVGYNVRFDKKFIKKEIKALQENHCVDCLEIARLLLPDLDNHKLITVAKKLGFANSQEHRAMGDVILTYKCFEELMKKGKKKGLVIEFYKGE